MEDFVTYELAVKLREKGFNESCYKYYQRGVLDSDDCWNKYNRGTADRCSAPTISQVLDWLRKEKKVHVRPSVYFIGWCYDITMTEGEYKRLHGTECEYYSYEEATLAGIEYVLDNLI